MQPAEAKLELDQFLAPMHFLEQCAPRRLLAPGDALEETVPRDEVAHFHDLLFQAIVRW